MKKFDLHHCTQEELDNEVVDIVKFIDDRINIEASIHGNMSPWIDIMSLVVRFSRIFGAFTSTDIYIALLEQHKNFETFNGVDTLRNDCLTYISMLLSLKLFDILPDEDEITTNTYFKPIIDHRFGYFICTISQLEDDIFEQSHKPIDVNRSLVMEI